jgi:hypothetical protein
MTEKTEIRKKKKWKFSKFSELQGMAPDQASAYNIYFVPDNVILGTISFGGLTKMLYPEKF